MHPSARPITYSAYAPCAVNPGLSGALHDAASPAGPLFAYGIGHAFVGSSGTNWQTIMARRALGGTRIELLHLGPAHSPGDISVWLPDAKVVIDDNGLLRQAEMEELRDPDSESKWEKMAREMGLSYVKLDGDVGCCVNGAVCR